MSYGQCQRLRSGATEVVSALIRYTIFLGSLARSFKTATTRGIVVKTIPGPLDQATNDPDISRLKES